MVSAVLDMKRAVHASRPALLGGNPQIKWCNPEIKRVGCPGFSFLYINTRRNI